MLSTVLKGAFGPVFKLDDRMLRLIWPALAIYPFSSVLYWLYDHSPLADQRVPYELLLAVLSFANLLVNVGLLMFLAVAWQRTLLLPDESKLTLFAKPVRRALERFVLRLVQLGLVLLLFVGAAILLLSILGQGWRGEGFELPLPLLALMAVFVLGMWGSALTAASIGAARDSIMDSFQAGRGIARKTMLANLIVFVLAAAIIAVLTSITACCVAGVLKLMAPELALFTDFELIPNWMVYVFRIPVIGARYRVHELVMDQSGYDPAFIQEVLYWTDAIMTPVAMWLLVFVHAGANATLYRMYRRDGLPVRGGVPR
ncbi:hypothetical protein [Kordiimonas gwangyangensis]|uniref:hypothetical protein n=1 Tax=Kordiimonas gwangyangensis TaxID=288022 RepID=UPI0003770E1A|nr:hypothetical protein [Kordiimonas gwangyangensis]